MKNTGRNKLVIAALWSEMCLAQPVIHAMGDGYEVYAVTDATLPDTALEALSGGAHIASRAKGGA